MASESAPLVPLFSSAEGIASELTKPNRTSTELQKSHSSKGRAPTISPVSLVSLNHLFEEFLRHGRSIHLEGLGFILPQGKKRTIRRVHRETFSLLTQTVQSIEFEKCDDASCLPPEKLQGVVDTKEIVVALQQLDESLADTSTNIIRKALKETIKGVKRELLTKGFSRAFARIGTLTAVGDLSPERGLSGADVFLVPSHTISVTSEKTGPFIRPLLQDSFELLTAALGEPVAGTTILLREFLGEDYDGSFSVGAFRMRGAQPKLILASDGLRSMGAEFIIEIPLQPHETVVIPGWGLSMMALGWFALQTISARKLIRGVVVSAGGELLPGRQHLLVHERSGIRDRHLSIEGEFMYLSLVAITEAEAMFVKQAPTELLIHAMQKRGMKGITKPQRPDLWRGISFIDDHQSH